MRRLHRAGAREVVDGYLRYKAYAVNQEYVDLDGAQRRLERREEEWPEYKTSSDLVARPLYWECTDNTAADKEEWLRNYLGRDVQSLQELKRHHVHPPNYEGERRPLMHCRRPDNPTCSRSEGGPGGGLGPPPVRPT